MLWRSGLTGIARGFDVAIHIVEFSSKALVRYSFVALPLVFGA